MSKTSVIARTARARHPRSPRPGVLSSRECVTAVSSARPLAKPAALLRTRRLAHIRATRLATPLLTSLTSGTGRDPATVFFRLDGNQPTRWRPCQRKSPISAAAGISSIEQVPPACRCLNNTSADSSRGSPSDPTTALDQFFAALHQPFRTLRSAPRSSPRSLLDAADRKLAPASRTLNRPGPGQRPHALISNHATRCPGRALPPPASTDPAAPLWVGQPTT